MACKYFRPYLEKLCCKLNKLDLGNYDLLDDDMAILSIHIHNNQYICIRTYEKEIMYDTNKSSDILNYHRLKFICIQQRAKVKIILNCDIFGIKKYIKIRNILCKYLNREITYCSRYDYKVINTILLAAYYYKKYGFKNLIKKILYYYFNLNKIGMQ